MSPVARAIPGRPLAMRAGALLIDIEGTLLKAKGTGPVDGAVDWFAGLAERGIPYLLATNITTDTPDEVAAKMRDSGFDVGRSDIISPLSMLKERVLSEPMGRVLSFGLPRLKNYLEEIGLELTDGPGADTVLLGWDPTVSFNSLSAAVTALVDNSARLVALHENRIFRHADGLVSPGVGSFVRALEYASGRKAEILGKPGADFFTAALKKLGFEARETMMIGDDAPGEIAGAKRFGMSACFVLSGQYRDTGILSMLKPTERPDLVLSDVTEISLD